MQHILSYETICAYVLFQLGCDGPQRMGLLDPGHIWTLCCPATGDGGVVTLSPRNNSGPCAMTSRMLRTYTHTHTRTLEQLGKALKTVCDYPTVKVANYIYVNWLLHARHKQNVINAGKSRKKIREGL